MKGKIRPYETTFEDFVEAIQRDSLDAIMVLMDVLKHYIRLTTKENRLIEVKFKED